MREGCALEAEPRTLTCTSAPAQVNIRKGLQQATMDPERQRMMNNFMRFLSVGALPLTASFPAVRLPPLPCPVYSLPVTVCCPHRRYTCTG